MEDVNECALLPGLCANGRCSNTFGGFMCSCDNGYALSEDGVMCLDVDECAEDPLVCGDGDCVNTDGGYECRCPYGFFLSSDGR